MRAPQNPRILDLFRDPQVRGQFDEQVRQPRACETTLERVVSVETSAGKRVYLQVLPAFRPHRR
jgi:hypothetical protein